MSMKSLSRKITEQREEDDRRLYPVYVRSEDEFRVSEGWYRPGSWVTVDGRPLDAIVIQNLWD